MAITYEVPTSPQPSSQQIVLNGTLYQLSLNWCDPAQCWMLDVADQNNNPIVGGIPLVTGADLLVQLAYLSIGSGGALIVQSDNNPDLVPSFETLGSTGHLFFVSPNA